MATLRLTKSALAAVDRSPGPHRQRGSEEGHGRHCPGQRPPPAPGEAINRDGAGRGEGHRGGSPRDTRAEPSELRTPGMHGVGARWTSPCCPFSGMACFGDRRPRRSGGATWSARRTARRGSTYAGRRRTRRRRARSCTSARRPPRPWWPSCRRDSRWLTRQRRCSGCPPARSAGG